MIELKTSNVRDFKLTICEGRVVVRSQSRIFGLLGVRENLIPIQFQGLLAIPVFSGSGTNEEIIWTTDKFSSTPKRLSDLSGDEKDKYNKLLQDALSTYAEAIADATEDVKRLLYAAITYISEYSIFCGEDRLVITEWGVTPLNGCETLGMPIGIEKETSEGKKEVTEKGIIDSQISEEAINIPKEASVNTSEEDSQTYKKKDSEDNDLRKKNSYWYWIVALLLIVAVVVICLLANGCSSPMKTVLDTTPELTSENIVISKDSVNYIASNRLMLMITADDATIAGFVGEFRKDYPDASKYILSSPDSLLRRITLTLPDNERESFEQELPVKYGKYGLLVIPDAMYKSSSTVTNDPDLQMQDKRWYFDECGVFDAWDVTMGDQDIVVLM